MDEAHSPFHDQDFEDLVRALRDAEEEIADLLDQREELRQEVEFWKAAAGAY